MKTTTVYERFIALLVIGGVMLIVITAIFNIITDPYAWAGAGFVALGFVLDKWHKNP